MVVTGESPTGLSTITTVDNRLKITGVSVGSVVVAYELRDSQGTVLKLGTVTVTITASSTNTNSVNYLSSVNPDLRIVEPKAFLGNGACGSTILRSGLTELK